MADALDVKFEPTLTLRAHGVHRVYTRGFWDSAWTEQTHLHCTECSWSAPPSMPSASFLWRYGQMSHDDQLDFSTVLKLNLSGFYIKVEFDTDTEDETRNWYGLVQLDNDQLAGALIDLDPDGDPPTPSSLATGAQTFTAYGLEKLLAQHQVHDALVDDGAGGLNRVEKPPVFNRDGLANRSPGRIPDPATASDRGSYVFSDDPDSAEFWSTADIVEYLLRHQTPTDLDGERKLKFYLPIAGVETHKLPTWDRPELPQENATTYSLIEQLANRRRLYQWRLVVEELDDPPEEIKLLTNTLVADPVTIPLTGADPLPANDRCRTLSFDTDPMTSACLRASDVELVSQVIVRGARRVSVATFSIDEIFTAKLAAGWTVDAEAVYTVGAVGATGFGAADLKTRQQMHSEARSRPLVDEVYSFFRIPKDWGRVAGPVPVFPTADGGTPYPVYYPDMFVERALPLFEGVDYKDDNIKNGTVALPPEGERVQMGPLAVLWDAARNRFVNAAKIGLRGAGEITDPDEFNRFSVSVRVPAKSKGVRLDVHGAPQHVINAKNFLYRDEDEKLGGWNYKAGLLKLTLALPDDRYCEGRWPDPVADLSDVVRTKLIWAGDSFRKDYVAEGTVVGVDEDGHLIFSNGGFIPHEHADDDEHKLAAAAKLAGAWYTRVHQVLCLKSRRLKAPSELELGDLITTIGDDRVPGEGHHNTINSVISEIKISTPLGTPQAPTEAQLQLTTWAGELEPLLLAPPDTDAPAAAPLVDLTALPPGLDLGVTGGAA